MNYRSLGRTGVMVSPICIGSFNFSAPTPDDEAERIVRCATDAGINFFDTADSYNGGESERMLGRALAATGTRDQIVLASKVHFPTGPGPNDRGNSRLHIMRSVEESLRRLGTDRIDLLQMHRASFDIPVDETLGALTDLIRQGKILYAGCSTHPAWKIMEAVMVSEIKHLTRYISEQPPYNLLDRRIENELVPMCRAHGLAIIPYAPLAQGVLAGRYDNDTNFPTDSRAAVRGGIYAGRVNAAGIAAGRKMSALARDAGMTPAQFAFMWAKGQPGITAPIFGPRTLAQLEEIIPSLDRTLTDEMRAACDEIVPPGSAVTDFHNGSFWLKQALTVNLG